jgi:hypothetical protein
VSRVEVRDGNPVVVHQLAAGAVTAASRLGTEGAEATDLAGLGLEDGSTHFVVEVFYRYASITPLSRVFSVVLPDPLYERAVF